MSLPSPATPGRPSRAARAAHACCFAVAVLVTGHAVLAVLVIALAEPNPEMEGPSVFVAYIFMGAVTSWLVLEGVVSWLVAVLAVRAHSDGGAAALVVLCGVALLHGLFTLFLAGQPGTGTPIAYTLTHLAVVVLAVVTVSLLVATLRTAGGSARPERPPTVTTRPGA